MSRLLGGVLTCLIQQLERHRRIGIVRRLYVVPVRVRMSSTLRRERRRGKREWLSVVAIHRCPAVVAMNTLLGEREASCVLLMVAWMLILVRRTT